VFNGLVFMSYAAALPVLQREWSMSGAQAGAVAGGFQIGYALSLVFFSSLADRVSPTRIYLWSLFAAGLSALGFAIFARDFTSALILHTTVGVALGGTYTTGVMILADQYDVRSRGMAVGVFIASTSCGYALSLLISGGALPAGGYRLSFFLTGLGPLLGWAIAGWTLRSTVVPAAGRRKDQRFRREVLTHRPTMLLIWGYVFHNWELLGMWSWTPAFLAACFTLAGATHTDAAGSGAFMTALFHGVGLLASFSMGALSDRLDRAAVMLTLAAISMSCSFVFGWTVDWPLAWVMGIGGVYAFSSLGDSPILSAALTETVDSAYLGAALGLRSLLGFGAAALAPMVFGLILDWTNPAAGDQRLYTDWGWAFSILGLGGAGAVWAARRFRKHCRPGAAG
jgi:MFS family permease